MKLQDAQNLAIELMKKHNLLIAGWSFEFDNAKRRLGCCKHRTKRITLSKHVTLINDEIIIRNTILHEIAHALVGSGHGHNWVWKNKALEIGCNGNRLCSDGVKVEGKYVAHCDGCDKVYYAHRRKKRTSSCGTCSGGRYNPKYKLEYKLNIK